MTPALAATAIDLYQKFVSPHKGFRCAHRARHGRPSCSQFAKRLVAKVGLFRSAPLFLRRLKRCGDAADALRADVARQSGYVKAARDADDAKRRRSVARFERCGFRGCDVRRPSGRGTGGAASPAECCTEACFLPFA